MSLIGGEMEKYLQAMAQAQAAPLTVTATCGINELFS